jgi:hypothetical protein
MFARNAAAAAAAALSLSHAGDEEGERNQIEESKYAGGHVNKKNCPWATGYDGISDRADSATSSPLSAEFALHIQQSGPISDTSSTTSFTYAPLVPSHSRLQAQSRILAARKAPLMQIRIYDPQGHPVGSKTVGGFLGSVESGIVYDLRPDAGLDEKWFAGVEDILGGDEHDEKGQGEDGIRRVDIMRLF